jgi:uncharacterized protein YjiS (DUF1127 family)
MLQHMTNAFRRSPDRARSRRAFACLVSMDDHLLRDIGVHRGDVRSRVFGLDRA